MHEHIVLDNQSSPARWNPASSSPDEGPDQSGCGGVLLGIRFSHVLWTMCRSRSDICSAIALHALPPVPVTRDVV